LGGKGEKKGKERGKRYSEKKEREGARWFVCFLPIRHNTLTDMARRKKRKGKDGGNNTDKRSKLIGCDAPFAYILSFTSFVTPPAVSVGGEKEKEEGEAETEGRRGCMRMGASAPMIFLRKLRPPVRGKREEEEGKEGGLIEEGKVFVWPILFKSTPTTFVEIITQRERGRRAATKEGK